MLIGYMYIKNRNLVITVPADGLALKGAGPSAETVMASSLNMISSKAFLLLMILDIFLLWCDEAFPCIIIRADSRFAPRQ